MGLVGSVALALGIGAALTGGAGIANAEGTGDTGSGDTTAQSAGAGTDTGPAGVKVRKPGSLGGPAADRVHRLITRSTQQDSTTRPRSNKTTTRQTGAGAKTVDPFVRRLADAADAVKRVGVRPAGAASSSNPDTVAQKVFSLPAALTVTPRAGLPLTTVTSGTGTPNPPVSMVLGALQLARREIESITQIRALPTTASPTPTLTNAQPAIAPEVPSPADEVPTEYGDIGKWMLKSDGEIADYGGQTYDGKTLLEPVNVIIVDPKSTSAAQANRRLNAAMFWSGFPAQPIHSTGFQGSIDDVTYGQRPRGPLQGYSDNFFIFPNDHGRIFGPDPVETSSGYVWSGAFSTEQFGIYNRLPAHTYVSSNTARAALAMALIASGRATYGGMVPLDNAYNTETTTTGDHDGYAVVLILT